LEERNDLTFNNTKLDGMGTRPNNLSSKTFLSTLESRGKQQG
jgi:hypothetical protein